MNRMPEGRSLVKGWIPIVAFALVAAACGSSSTGDTGIEEASPAEAQGGVAEAAGTVTEASTEPSAGTTEAEAGGEPETLADFLGFDFDDPDALDARLAENERRAQELIAVCMAGEGFEYVPFASTDTPNMRVRRLVLDEEEYARDRGFGITTWYASDEAGEGDSETSEDPNQAITATMSESERDAYFEALYGPPETDDEGIQRRGDVPFFGQPGGGCRGEAYEEVQGSIRRFIQTLAPALQDLNQRIQADSRVEEATGAWSACMADRGYQYESQFEVIRYAFGELGGRFEQIVNTEVDPFEGWSEEEVEDFLSERTDEEIDDFIQQAQDEAQADVDLEALAALQQEERDLAMANYYCGQDLQKVLTIVRPEYEQWFIDQNRDQLQQVRDG